MTSYVLRHVLTYVCRLPDVPGHRPSADFANSRWSTGYFSTFIRIQIGHKLSLAALGMYGVRSSYHYTGTLFRDIR